jgi:hypothetical protein
MGVLVGNRRDRHPEGLQQDFAATRLGFAQEALYLAEGLLYGVLWSGEYDGKYSSSQPRPSMSSLTRSPL